MERSADSVSSIYSDALRQHQRGDLAEAERLYRRVLNISPDHSFALHGLGILARIAGRPDEAVGLIRRAISLRPEVAEYHTNLGNALLEMGQAANAIAAHQQAIALDPKLPQAHNNLAKALWSMKRQKEAMVALRSALALDPRSAETLTNLGNGLRESGQSDEALAAHRSAVRLRPDIPELHLNLGNTLALRGELEESLECYRKAIALRPDSAGFHSQLILTLLYVQTCSPHMLREELERWNQRHAAPLRNQIQAHSNDPAPDRRLRIGFVSGLFRSHVCAGLLEPLLRHLSREQFDVVCYSTFVEQDAITERFKSLADLWHNVERLNDEQLAARICADRIDILVDLHLHTSENRLPVFARKPAPIQVTWLGYPGSTGIPSIDYRITDPYLDPAESDDGEYVERSVRLSTFWCYGPDGTEPPVGPLPASINGHITFGCLNNFCKINEGVLDLWSRVVSSVPRSALVILCDEGSHRTRLVEHMARHGIASDHIRFEPRRSRREYLDLYNQIDIALDTFPYSGHTTTLDATWMG
ncbi:MAG TPA: tetratricopeptide repeat protein, partial [Tepidisphaeraceae bacterium]|nr:tetratricopeptide repeat protein [Tepidisphaeraceae bacterium]